GEGCPRLARRVAPRRAATPPPRLIQAERRCRERARERAKSTSTVAATSARSPPEPPAPAAPSAQPLDRFGTPSSHVLPTPCRGLGSHVSAGISADCAVVGVTTRVVVFG